MDKICAKKSLATAGGNLVVSKEDFGEFRSLKLGNYG